MISLCIQQKSKYSLFYKTSAANVHHCSSYLLLCYFCFFHSKLYSVDGSNSELHEYDVVTLSLQTVPLVCPARYLSHIENDGLFYSCPSDGVYQFNLNTYISVLVYDDTTGCPFGDVTSYMNNNQVFWARDKCIFAETVGGCAVTQLHCFNSETIQGLTVVHPSLQP